tara:strand:+ start:209 stop:592 length:384 start_codon:yes stop_codon:yes gene_type:complete
MKKILLCSILLLISSNSFAENLTCTVKSVLKADTNGAVTKQGTLPYEGKKFFVNTSSGQISGLVMDNVSSPLCNHQILSEGTTDNSLKIFTNCGDGSQVEYLNIATWSNKEFVAIATSNTVITGSCK